jgi:hypothetical protein
VRWIAVLAVSIGVLAITVPAVSAAPRAPVAKGGGGQVGQGAIDIVPKTPIGRDSLVTAFEQDKALPALKAVSP